MWCEVVPGMMKHPLLRSAARRATTMIGACSTHNSRKHLVAYQCDLCGLSRRPAFGGQENLKGLKSKVTGNE
jgi:hypothetical protein